MKLLLKDFQETAVNELARKVRGAAKEAKTGDLQAVSLASTTGSGKTVMLTAAIERLLQGDDDTAPLTDATFLWITDQPELNEQTRKKMLETSSVLDSTRLLVIDASFDREVLAPGVVHFLNTQKIGKEKGLVTPGDARTFTIWDSIRNTVEARPGRFFVIIDEAHRGMIEEKGAAEAATIIQKFIKGSPGEIPPVPVVIGISATPERFTALLSGTSRSTRPVAVDVADVRASGLIKDTIVLHHPTKHEPTDMTMLREAATGLKEFTARWAAYCAAQEEFTVLPLLVVQVEDGNGKGVFSETDIAQAMRVIRDTVGTMSNDAFAHAFQEGTRLTIDGEELRYIAPSDIQQDQDVRVIFFKTSLNTGWDCPRAEVMMSFRVASDATYIAQLVGRMVRTPLARRIVDNESLNTVALYLPHYDKKGVERVVAKLSKPDDSMAPVDIAESDNIVELRKAPKSDPAFAALAAVPSYLVPRRRKASQVRRVMKFARLLARDELNEDAESTALALLLRTLDDEYATLATSEYFHDVVEERGQIDIEAVNWDVGTDVVRDGEKIRVNIAAENVDDLFEATGRKLNEGLHKHWWRSRVKAGIAPDRAKLELFALGTQPDVIAKVESAAQGLVTSWLKEYGFAIGDLSEESRGMYEEIKNLALTPEVTPLTHPTIISATRGERAWKRHLYVDEAGVYHADFNKDETAVVERELANKSVLWWLRNADRKPWALCIPYEFNGETRATYPDFLFVRSVKGRLVVDIVEPHSISHSDSPAKAAGFADFAAKHADKFGKIELILLDDKKQKRLDLTDESIRNRVRGVTVLGELQALFKS